MALKPPAKARRPIAQPIAQLKRLAQHFGDGAFPPPKTATWQSQRPMRLLQGSREFFPALVADMEAAQTQIYFETYIFDTAASGQVVAEALMAAARRGVAVHLVIDGLGSRDLSMDWKAKLAQAGVQLRVFSPPGRWLLLMRQQWQRLHRKLCAIDGHIAYCGGINVLDDFHDPNHGALEQPRLDFSVRVSGQLAAHIDAACQALWLKLQSQAGHKKTNTAMALAGIQSKADALRGLGRKPKQAALVLRDNLSQRRSIERSYLRAIARARQEVLVANAYFFPSRKLLAALCHAAGRGVQVRLLLQGRYEYFLQAHASRAFYARLLQAGVEIYEYEASFLHAKVAVIDAHSPRSWATVGSSNLDPLSLLLAREANVVSRQRDFAQDLQTRLQAALAQGRRVLPAHLAQRPWHERLFDKLAYALARSMVWLVKDHF
jgi:cardiolipin synthase